MIKLRITPDGRICGLWTDNVQLRDLGALKVRRASHVEFDDRRQCWCVREAEPGSAGPAVAATAAWLPDGSSSSLCHDPYFCAGLGT